MNGQEPPLASRSDLRGTRQWAIGRQLERSHSGKGGGFPQGGKHRELEGCGRGRMEDGKARGSDEFRKQLQTDDDGGQLANRIFILIRGLP